MHESRAVGTYEQAVLDRHAGLSAVELFVPITLAVAIAVEVLILPNETRIRIGYGHLPIRHDDRLPTAARQRPGLSIESQLRADVTAFRWIEANQPSRPFAMLHVVAA